MIEEISGDKLNLMPGEYGLWFRGPNTEDFSLIFTAHEVQYFEVNFKGGHFCGGLKRPLRFGRIQRELGEKAVGFKRADLIEYIDDLPDEQLARATDFVSQCSFEERLKTGIIQFLSSKGRVKTGLRSDEAFETFLAAQQSNKVKTSTRNWRKPILSIALTCVFLALVFWTHSLLNISYYERTCSEGSVWSCRKLIVIEMIRGNHSQVQRLERLEAGAMVAGSREQLQSECDQANFESCLKLYQIGEYAPGEERLLEWACKGANPDYCLEQALARMQKEGGPTKESVQRLKETLKGQEKLQLVLAALDSGVNMTAGESVCRSEVECRQFAEVLEAFGLHNFARTHYEQACNFNDLTSCMKFATLSAQEGKSEVSEQIYRRVCLQDKNPEACYKAAYAQFDDPEDRKSLRIAYSLCQKGSENYCLFLYDRVNRNP